MVRMQLGIQTPHRVELALALPRPWFAQSAVTPQPPRFSHACTFSFYFFSNSLLNLTHSLEHESESLEIITYEVTLPGNQALQVIMN
jgi:hypothetical protein